MNRGELKSFNGSSARIEMDVATHTPEAALACILVSINQLRPAGTPSLDQCVYITVGDVENIIDAITSQVHWLGFRLNLDGDKMMEHVDSAVDHVKEALLLIDAEPGKKGPS